MKKLLLSTAAILVAAPALAADLPRRTAAAAPAPAPVFTQVVSWQGLYVGAQLGYAWGEAETIYTAPPALVGVGVVETEGLIGGLHAGYNWQRGSLVYGLEADVEYANTDGSAIVTLPPATTVLGAVAVENQLRGSLRARFGFAFDRALLYVTGGLAVGKIEAAFAAPAGTPVASGSDWRFGWTVGAGVEYALSSNWSARLEYRYTDFGDFNLTLPTGVIAGATSANIDTTEHAVRVGVSYRFGGPVRPVVARY